jgi:DNA transposition AAA+ family ATPase
MDKNELPDADGNGPLIKWDDVTIARECEHLPPDLRQPYRWLKTYGREHCHRDLDVLTNHFAAAGVHHDRTTWSKIVRGRWKRNRRGEEVATPVMAKERLLDAIQSLQINSRRDETQGLIPFVETPAWESIRDYIDLKREPQRVNKFGIIVGPTGAQKSASFKRYHLLNNHGTGHVVECPERSNYGEFLTLWAECYGGSKRGTFDQKRAKIREATALGTAAQRARRYVVFDNAQELWREDSGPDQPAFSFMRRVQDETGITIILSITDLFEKTLLAGLINGYFEQFEGRTGGRRSWLRLPKYATDEDVRRIAEALGFGTNKETLAYLGGISREPGRIRRLFEDLQEAKRLAAADDEPLALKHLREARGDL